MQNKKHSYSSLSRTTARGVTAALLLAIAVAFGLTLVSPESAQAQTYSKLHDFSGPDGALPFAGLTMDKGGNLYGTTFGNGSGGNVFKLTPKGSGWVESVLYSFIYGTDDGSRPEAKVIFNLDGLLYGTTTYGGPGCGEGPCGIVFSLQPQPQAPRSVLASWKETRIHDPGSDFGGGGNGTLATDQVGNLYGTAGVLYELIRDQEWKASILYNGPQGGTENTVIFDTAGNLYGTTPQNPLPDGNGTVVEWTPSDPPPWNESVLHTFTYKDGSQPIGGLLFDTSGNLYGTTKYGGTGAHGGGVVFQLTPSGGGWIYSVIYNFDGYGPGPLDSLIMDPAGNLIGTTNANGAYGYGAVFKLTNSNDTWTYKSLHDFCAAGPPCVDGASPYGGVIRDAGGNLYGTTEFGGAHGDGVVFQITPPY